MSVSTTIVEIDYLGNGTSTAYPTVFQFLQAADLVVNTQVSGGALVLNTLGVDYTVSGGAGSTGTVNFTVAPPSLCSIFITRATDKTQPMVLSTQGSFPPKAIEGSADKATMRDQELDARTTVVEGDVDSLNESVSELQTDVEELQGAAFGAGLFLSAGIDGEPLVTVPSRSPRRMYWDRDASEFGVVVNGPTDSASLTANTTACQAALTWAYSTLSSTGVVTRLLWPAGKINHNGTLLLRGTGAACPAIIGGVQGGKSFDGNSTCFVWYGASGGTQLFVQSGNNGVMEDIGFDGRSLAKYNVEYSATTLANRSVQAATSGFNTRRCAFLHVQNVTGAACMAIGTDPTLTGGSTYQFSEGVWENIYCNPLNPGAPGFDASNMLAAAWKSQCGGNCKNFTLSNFSVVFAGTLVDWGAASGALVLRQMVGSTIACSLIAGSGDVEWAGGDIENDSTVTDFKLIYGTPGLGGAAIRGVQVSVTLATVGGIKTMTNYGGPLHLSDNILGASGAAFLCRVGKVFESRRNHFDSCGSTDSPWAPFVDGSGNEILGGFGFGRMEPTLGDRHVLSEGDTGGVSGSPIYFRDTKTALDEFVQLKPILNGYITGAMRTAPRCEGQHVRGHSVYYLDYRDVIAAASGSTSHAIFLKLRRDAALKKLWAEIVTPFAGVASCTLGFDLVDGSNDQKLMTPQDPTQAAGTYMGKDLSQRGHIFTPGDGAYDPDGAYFTTSSTDNAGSWYFSGGSALSGLTAGLIRIHVLTEYYGL